ncbi:hypothetical protein ACFVYA_26545 [Amycolatopsis sp. NPDC058278]|uniref:hypothetical protein n=1 Tax=Amycolatopsis sp. NPDC058278 TaxID=3346417 RepID=UPI0036DD68C4
MPPKNPHLSHRDRAVLHAVADGRCRRISHTLFVDSAYCADQFVADHLAEIGLLSATEPVRLTPSAQLLLKAA